MDKGENTMAMSQKLTATAHLNRMDLRLRRAQNLCAALMHAIEPHIDRRGETSMSDVHRVMLGILHDKGVEVLTDYDRQEMGLAFRDTLGWTTEEIHAYDRRMLEAMIAPNPMFIAKP
jgi:hypothetical protein